MIKPYYAILGKQVPSYGMFICLGVAFAAIIAILVCKRKGIDRYDVVCSAVYTGIGGFLGAKLLFILVSLEQIIENKIPITAVFMGGFVFYGGVLGGAVGLYIYCRQFKLNIGKFFDLYAMVLPLAHAFGRVGCFFSGCCYGIPHNGFFSHTYHISIGNTPLGTPLLATQLIEAIGLILIFLAGLLVYVKTTEIGFSVSTYMLTYSILRFSIEFFRGDAERGKLLLSTSQWISLLLFAVAMIIFAKKFHAKKLQKCFIEEACK